LGRELQRDHHTRHKLLRLAFDVDTSRGAVDDLKTLTNVVQPHICTRAGRVRGYRIPRVADRDEKLRTPRDRIDGHGAASDAVLDRVFSQRLQDETGDDRGEQIARAINLQ